MRQSTEISFIKAVFNAKVFKKKTPFLVSWEITNRCNKRCKYCDIWQNTSVESGTDHVFSMIDELSRLGTKVVHFTGGEPLLREDIGIILEKCSKNGILTSINSNGSLFLQRIKELTNLNLLGLSLDGPQEVHDDIRGDGSYKEVIEAIVLARQKRMRVRIHTVLSRLNLKFIDFVLDKAEELDAPVIFQPSTTLLLGGHEKNLLSPDEKEYKQAIREIVAKKKKTKYICNSISGLKFLYYWPHLERIRCLAGSVSCRIESDGSVDVCFRNQLKSNKRKTNDLAFGSRFYSLPVLYCEKCCCASSVELNCLLALRLDTIFNTWGMSGLLFNN